MKNIHKKKSATQILHGVIIGFFIVAIFSLGMKIYANSSDTGLPEEYIQYCEEVGQIYNICPELLESIIEKESNGNPNTVGAAGEIGLMQIYPKYHTERMDKLGVYDLHDPRGNIFVEADYPEELFKKYEDIGTVLMIYSGAKNAVNRGAVGDYSDYARSVMERSHELEVLHGK